MRYFSTISRRRRAGVVAVPAVLLVLALLPVLAGAPSAAAASGDIVVAAAGDIIGTCSGSGCDYQKVGDVIRASGATRVLALGDISNNSGAASDYTGRFQTAWGSFKSAISPVPGNHDYGTPNAANYFSYFGAAAHPPNGYYSLDLGSWHVVALNSNCAKVGGCAAGSLQETWLRTDLASDTSPCTLAFWHHPRYSSGHDGDNVFMKDLYADLYAHGADIVLSGHSHDYERFAPQDNASRLDTAHGIAQFVVGTGGAFFTGFGATKPNSLTRQNTAMGALVLTLHSGSYNWRFAPIAGASFTDSGSATCHGGGQGDQTPPTTPSALHTTSVTSTAVGLAWNASSDNVGVTGYRVYRDGTLLTTVGGTTPTWTDGSVAAGRSYTYAVSAIDAVGNESGRATTTVTTPGGTRTVVFAPTDDATIDQSAPTTNYGAASRLTVDNSPVNHLLLKFAVTGLGNCTVTGARLRLTVGTTTNDNSPRGGDFYAGTSSNWSESTVTWNTAPAAAGTLASLGAVSLGTTYLVDVSALVHGETTVTIRATSTSTDGARYYSKEGSSTQAPQLQVSCA